MLELDTWQDANDNSKEERMIQLHVSARDYRSLMRSVKDYKYIAKCHSHFCVDKHATWAVE